MSFMRSWSTWALAALILLSLGASVVLAAPATQDADNGKVLWEESLCKNCHGEAGEGMWAGPLAGNAKTGDEWIAQVRSPRNRMPTFSPEKITDEMITDMHAYLTSLQAPASFQLADAGLAEDANAGQKLIVEKKCVGCHSPAGPIRGFNSRGEMPTAEAVVQQLRTPRNNMPMFSAAQVSDEEAATIVAFLVTQFTPAELPASGGAGSITMAATLLLIGAAAVAIGFGYRSLRVRL